MSEAVLIAENLQKSYGRKRVLNGGGFTARAGELVGIVGENGSGKSTLLKLLAGILKPDGGRIIRNHTIGYCPQDAVLYEYLTPQEHFQLFGAAYDLSDAGIERRSDELLEYFAFSRDRHRLVHQLSGGTRQKLNLSLALLHDPALLLLDEPYTGFDWETYQHFLAFTEQAKSQGKCIVMVSHLVFERHRFDAIFHVQEGVIHEEKI
jgi:ABC-type multidrug transport system ATPase subunit